MWWRSGRGWIFFSELPDKLEDKLEGRVNRKLWSWDISSSTASDDDSGEVTERRATKITREELDEYPYVASQNSDKFHHNSCRYAKKIHEENLIGYKTRKAAVADGREPCGVCEP